MLFSYYQAPVAENKFPGGTQELFASRFAVIKDKTLHGAEGTGVTTALLQMKETTSCPTCRRLLACSSKRDSKPQLH